MNLFIQRNALEVASRTGVNFPPRALSPSTWSTVTSMNSTTWHCYHLFFRLASSQIFSNSLQGVLSIHFQGLLHFYGAWFMKFLRSATYTFLCFPKVNWLLTCLHASDIWGWPATLPESQASIALSDLEEASIHSVGSTFLSSCWRNWVIQSGSSS